MTWDEYKEFENARILLGLPEDASIADITDTIGRLIDENDSLREELAEKGRGDDRTDPTTT